MIKEIVKDVFALSLISEEVKEKDPQLEKDLLDTLLFHKDHCVGLAANMIDVNKRAIIFFLGNIPFIMYNPKIVSRKEEYSTYESCLSHEGSRPTKRYQKVTIEYLSTEMKKSSITLTGISAQAVQHECDHLEGIII